MKQTKQTEWLTELIDEINGARKRPQTAVSIPAPIIRVKKAIPVPTHKPRRENERPLPLPSVKVRSLTKACDPIDLSLRESYRQRLAMALAEAKEQKEGTHWPIIDKYGFRGDVDAGEQIYEALPRRITPALCSPYRDRLTGGNRDVY